MDSLIFLQLEVGLVQARLAECFEKSPEDAGK
jgi:hypothetical protein